MRIAIATDHNGVEQKHELIKALKEKGIEVIDGSMENTPTDDYPDFAFKVAQSVVKKEADLGILLCGTGIGMSISANKIKGIRCAKVSTVEEAGLAREHNDANVIALSYKEPLEDLEAMIFAFIETPFSGDERHRRRIDKIRKLESQYDN